MGKPQIQYSDNANNVVHIDAFQNGTYERTTWQRIYDGFIEQIKLQHNRLFFWAPVFLSFGIGLYFLLPLEPPMLLGLFFLAIALASLVLIPQDNPILRTCVLALLVLPATGFVASQFHIMRIHTPIVTKEIGPVTITGTIQSIEITKMDYDARLVLSDLKIEDVGKEDTPKLIRLRLRKDYGVQTGERISALAKLMPPSEPLIPGGFDFRRYLYFQSIGAVGFIYSQVEKLEQAPKKSMGQTIEKLRESITRKIYASINNDNAPIAAALINGQRAGISDENRETLRHSGLAHLLAISGLHLGLVCGSLFFAVRLILASIGSIALHYPIKKYAAIIALIGGFCYMLIAGSTIPTQRAMLMSTVVFGAILMDRSPFSLRLVAFAALVVLIITPASLLSASFQLSFAAVTALVAFYDWLRPYMSEWYRNAGTTKKVAFYFLSVSATSFIAGLATAPFSLYHFQEFATYGLLSNMIAIPIMAFWVMPMAIISMLAMPMGLEHFPLIAMGHGIGWIKDIARFVAELDGSVLRIQAYPFSVFLIIVASLLAFVLLKGRIRVMGLLIFLCAVPFIFMTKQPSILISSTYKLMMLEDQGRQYSVNTMRREKFVRENWERQLGKIAGSSKMFGVRNGDACDNLGCRFEIKGKKIAYSTQEYGQTRDCAWADLMLADYPIRSKCTAQTIDFFDAYKNGGHAVYIQGENIEINHVGQTRYSKRPWSGSAKDTE